MKAATAEIDHLVVAAATLDAGVAWCERVLGVAPGPGGQHPLMGTHNRLLRLDGADRAYLEIIAIDPQGSAPTNFARWFGLDRPALQQQLAARGPRLVHWVARTSSILAMRRRLRALGANPGIPGSASRESALGLLTWRISVRLDGQPQLGGALPALIQWNGLHPATAMAASGVTLQRLQARSAPALEAMHTTQLELVAALPVPLRATLQTPRGSVTLDIEEDPA